MYHAVAGSYTDSHSIDRRQEQYISNLKYKKCQGDVSIIYHKVKYLVANDRDINAQPELLNTTVVV